MSIVDDAENDEFKTFIELLKMLKNRTYEFKNKKSNDDVKHCEIKPATMLQSKTKEKHL